MIWGGWDNDHGLELYVATPRYPANQQYQDSSKVLEFVDKKRLRERIDIIHIDELNGRKEFFDLIKNPQIDTRLPFLVCAHGCETGAVLGYSGLEEVMEILQSCSFKVDSN